MFGGPFGSAGLGALGLLYGIITADTKIEEENAQAQAAYQKLTEEGRLRYGKELDKDQQLEAAIEQELARQRELENQVTGTAGTAPVQTPMRASNAPQQRTVSGNPPAANSAPQNVQVAALIKSLPPQPFKNVEMRDVNGDGVPDLWIYYDPQKPGEVMRQEEASKGDGRVDTWSYFKDGQLIRRDVDSKGRGRPDTVFSYDKDQIVREERDEDGQGRMTYRASFQNGRLAKVEKDTTGSGRADLWIYYDSSRDGEVVIKEERDLNGDGAADLWSYFENGRLVRRDVSAIGLEILSKQEQLPAPTAGLKPLSTPGS